MIPSEIFAVKCPQCDAYISGCIVNETSEECLAEIGRAALTAAQIGWQVGITRGTVQLGECKCHEATILSDQRVSSALREALAAIEAIGLNPLATTEAQRIRFTKQDAADIVRAAMAKLGITPTSPPT